MHDTGQAFSHPGAAGDAERAAWMRVLALADPAMLNDAFNALGELPSRQWLRAPQTGMAMVRARTGGTGAQFNLGDITVTRCAVSLAAGTMGVAYVQGRSARHAEQAAVLDALLQTADWRDRIRQAVIEPLARHHAARKTQQAAATAATRVEFFTLARGEG